MCKKFVVYDNKIAGITSDCGRLDNCQKRKIYDNLFVSYDGETFGAMHMERTVYKLEMQVVQWVTMPQISLSSLKISRYTITLFQTQG